MKNAKIFVFVVVVLTLAMLACGPLGSAATPASKATSAPAGGGGSSATPASKATSAPAGGGGSSVTPTKAPEQPAASGEDLNLSSVSEGLSKLKSYKATMTMTFDGKDANGKPSKGSMDWTEEYVQDPKAQRVVLNMTGFTTDTTQMGNIEMVTTGGTQYIVMAGQDGKKSCISSSASDTSTEQGLFSPDTFGGISGAKYVKDETVNGVKTKHYAWSQGGLAGLGFTTGKGDVWVAVDGNYAVKYTAEATGKGSLFGSTGTEEGTITIDYNVTEVNQSFEITAPAECASATSDLPMMADATDKSQFGDMVTYTSASAFADVVQFYKDEMPKAGWEASGTPTEMEGVAMLEYTKDTQKASVTITFDKDKNLTSVLISVTKE